ncbi:hypothetical protein BO86DRAFT_392528 [Aspergillus japonicus CBS 114.51]|uniref:Uncharacterized protein n=1 Tax=Aspergillus japonicus CBS 114.51 TaxID=1448312 RepID=A0A8T8WPD4_ASPJA|nr:hypothetical protein BO86DRAFT_392528 [Aspergillus japonicus CBS 114.51]RAH77500.1 hypothetical protein BO86DRAFT_392528 [Aspergillus japonicus CBS 114.51]
MDHSAAAPLFPLFRLPLARSSAFIRQSPKGIGGDYCLQQCPGGGCGPSNAVLNHLSLITSHSQHSLSTDFLFLYPGVGPHFYYHNKGNPTLQPVLGNQPAETP